MNPVIAFSVNFCNYFVSAKKSTLFRIKTCSRLPDQNSWLEQYMAIRNYSLQKGTDRASFFILDHLMILSYTVNVTGETLLVLNKNFPLA